VALLACLALDACSVDDRVLMVPERRDGSGGPADGEVGATEIVIDTFEDGDFVPADARFAPWRFNAYAPADGLPDGAFATLSVDTPGYGTSQRALRLDWQVLRQAGDAGPTSPGVVLDVSLPHTTIDLNFFNAVVFASRYQHQGDCKAVPVLTVVVSCAVYGASFENYVEMSPDWKVKTVRFSDLTSATFGVTRERCLGAFDAIDLQAQVNLADGECASGTLWLDDVRIE